MDAGPTFTPGVGMGVAGAVVDVGTETVPIAGNCVDIVVGRGVMDGFGVDDAVRTGAIVGVVFGRSVARNGVIDGSTASTIVLVVSCAD